MRWDSTPGACQRQSSTLLIAALLPNSSALAEALTVSLMLGSGYMGTIQVLPLRSLLPLVLFLVFSPVVE